MAAAVTVIVPGRDVEPYAREALDSLVGQTRPDWTALLIDDGSTDATGAIFHDAAERDARFQVISHADARGLGAARNTALERVTTRFTAFLDADDVMRPGALERTLTTLERTGSDIVIGAYVRLRPDVDGYTAGEIQPWVAAATAPAREGVTLEDHPEATAAIVAWGKVSRTDLWRRHGIRFPEGKLYEDQVTSQRLHTLAHGIDTVPDVLVDWRVRADGSSITQREADLAVLADCLEQMLAGLACLDSGFPRAAAARRDQIRTMDLPRLRAIAAGHPDRSRYTDALTSFERKLNAQR